MMQRPRLLTQRLVCGDCIEVMAGMSDGSVDLVFGSPPYEDCRTYGIGFNLKGQEWVDWMVEVYRQSLRVCKGLVAFVVQGQTRKHQWSSTPALLITDLYRAGVCVRQPLIYHRIGIPGGGGKEKDHAAKGGSADWLRNDYEFIVCATNGGKLPWADTLSMGHKPTCPVGGAMSKRTKEGSRANDRVYNHAFPRIANPGNVISIGAVGGCNMGSKLCHENEAPFSEKLAEFFVKSFCPPQGVVLDCFVGSGTTCAVAKQLGRGYIGIDCRQSQIELSQRRLNERENHAGV